MVAATAANSNGREWNYEHIQNVRLGFRNEMMMVRDAEDCCADVNALAEPGVWLDVRCSLFNLSIRPIRPTQSLYLLTYLRYIRRYYMGALWQRPGQWRCVRETRSEGAASRLVQALVRLMRLRLRRCVAQSYRPLCSSPPPPMGSSGGVRLVFILYYMPAACLERVRHTDRTELTSIIRASNLVWRTVGSAALATNDGVSYINTVVSAA